MRQRGGTSSWRAGLVAAVVLCSTTALGTSAAHAEDTDAEPTLHLVTLRGPGTSASGSGTGTPAERGELLARQDAVLGLVEADPLYRWTTALNGFAAELTDDEAAALAGDERVALVEPNTVLDLAASGPSTTGARIAARPPRERGGAGITIGFVDSGIAAESAVFASVPGLGPAPRAFTGACQPGEGWTPDTCNGKLVGARWFVAGFGPDRVKSTESMSPLDVLGHGTHVASVAAGNAGVSVRVDSRDAGRFGGVAPQARVAAYKACWAAPDPQDDGCASADVVTAIDRAVGDRVDVLNLSLAGGSDLDTVQRALLGAAEADVVVVGAAGSTRRDAPAYASHANPWVLTVGAARGRSPRGRVVLGGRSVIGGGRPEPVTARLVGAGRAAAPGVRRQAARQCLPGSLDPRLVAGRIVVCERGGSARIDKSRAVAQADGVGMVLVNVRPGGVSADFHSVPTVHLDQRSARTLLAWMRERPRARFSLARDRDAPRSTRAAGWSAPGNPRGLGVKPDLVAPGDGVLGAAPQSSGRSWAVASGTSIAAARTTGLVAVLRARHDWSADVVRSVVATSARPLRGASVLSQGAGLLAADAQTTNLALELDPATLRRAVERGEWGDLNPATVLLRGNGRTTRTVTNIGRRAEYFSVRATGFARHRVQLRPLAVRLAPGESAEFTIEVTGPAGGRFDDGQLVWLGARGSSTRVPLAITR